MSNASLPDKKGIGKVITLMAKTFDEKLYSLEQEQLDAEYWHFKWNDYASLEGNIYEFHERLRLYGSFCERWEEHHNGSFCIVGRVRDKYLRPKIRNLIEKIKQNDN